MRVVTLGAGRIGELEHLYLGMHRHHKRVARVPLVQDDAESWRRRRAWYEEMLAGGEAFVLAAEDGDGTLAGYAFVSLRRGPDDTFPFGERWAELVSLAVAEDRRGGGIGGRLMDAVDAELGARGVADLQVAVMAGNDAALRFYARRGLREGEIFLYRFGGHAGAAQT
jgi:ribosomal protein S18 acetylase RimI-like enzyme